MIQITKMTKRIGSFSLGPISLELPDGYIMGLVGVNGAGKTSLLKTLLGLYRPDDGQILIDGRSYDTDEHSIREDIGFVLTEDIFETNVKIGQNVDYYGKYYSRYDAALCRQYLEEFELDVNKRSQQLSRGEKLKLQFAFALAHQPKYLIMDEPAGNFDPEFGSLFYRKLVEFVSDGAHSVLLSSHQTGGMERILDYLTFLADGKVVVAESMEALHQQYKLVSGEAYKIKLIPPERIIYMEEHAYGAKALVKNNRLHPFDAQLCVEDASIEDMMYYMVKGGYGKS